ncbi:hypothetical protein CLCR_09568 [Cladophialophora carrionii]|uniref:Uncharacterized protein n=1 Tax=Cladophialophora carrionii TaxID=86049 RepID=A0A1C1CWA7_9EURO|nr:hypothetical protein CLCR_09568 [Cladophialophora carrionii]
MTVTAGSITKDLEQYGAEATLDDLYQSKDTRHWMKEISEYVRKRANGTGSSGLSRKGSTLKRANSSVSSGLSKRRTGLIKLQHSLSLADPHQSWIDAPETLYTAQLPQGQGVAPPQGQGVAPPQGQGVAPPQGQDVAPPQGQDVAPPQGQDVAPPQAQKFSLVEAYQMAMKSTGDLWLATVRLTFLHLLFFDVSMALSPNSERISSNLERLVTKELESAGLTKVDQDRLHLWIRLGKFYNSLIEHLGEGCLFFLPADTALNGEPLSDSSIDPVVSHLRNLGIQEKIEQYQANARGKTLRNHLRDHIVQNLSRPGMDNLQALSSTPTRSHPMEPSTGLGSSQHNSGNYSLPGPENAQGLLTHGFHDSEVSDCLCGLLYSLGSSKIQDRLLLYGTLPQQRWSSTGEIHKINLADTGLDARLVRLFSSEHDLKHALEACVRQGVIVRTQSDDGLVAYSLCNEAQFSNAPEQDALMLQGLIFLAHVYPREEALHDSYHEDGKFLLPYLKRFWQYILSERCPPIPRLARESLTEASLAASRLGGSEEAMAVAEKMHQEGLPTYLKLALVHRKSVTLRMNGRSLQSEALILKALESEALNLEITADVRTRCFYGRLLLSNIENAIQQEQFQKALSYLGEIPIRQLSPSALEFQIVRLKSTVHGRLSRYAGDFPHAAECLLLCLETVKNTAGRYHHKHHLADVYCELQSPSEAQNLLNDDIEQLKTTNKRQSKAFRRLQLSFAEACILQKNFQGAESVLKQLEERFRQLSDQDITDQLGHVRSMFGLLRIDCYQRRWLSALERTDKVFNLMQEYQTFSTDSFHKHISLLFRAVILDELGQREQSLAAYQSAKAFKDSPIYFIPGMGTYVVEELKARARLRRLSDSE